MEWFSPEVFLAIFGSGSVLIAALRRWTNMPLRRKWTPEQRQHHMEQRKECAAQIKEIFQRINVLETDRTKNQTMIDVHTKNLDQILEKLAKLIEGQTAVKISVKYLEEKERIRNNEPKL